MRIIIILWSSRFLLLPRNLEPFYFFFPAPWEKNSVQNNFAFFIRKEHVLWCYKPNELYLTNHGANISWNILYKHRQSIQVSILLLSIRNVTTLPVITWCLPQSVKSVLKQLYHQLVLKKVFHGRNWSLQCLQVEKAGTKWNKANVCYFSLMLSAFNFQNAITFWMKPSNKLKISNRTFCCSMLYDQNKFLLMFTNLPGYQVNCVVTKNIIPCCCAKEDVLSCKFSFNISLEIRNPELHPW